MQERLSRRLWVRQLLALVGKEFQQIVRDPSSYLVAGVLPLLFLLLFGYGITLTRAYCSWPCSTRAAASIRGPC